MLLGLGKEQGHVRWMTWLTERQARQHSQGRMWCCSAQPLDQQRLAMDYTAKLGPACGVRCWMKAWET